MLTKRFLSSGLALDPSHFMLVMALSRVDFYPHTFLLDIENVFNVRSRVFCRCVSVSSTTDVETRQVKKLRNLNTNKLATPSHRCLS